MDGDGTMGKLVTAWVAIVIFVISVMGYFIDRVIDRHQVRAVRVFELAREYRVTLRQTNAQFSGHWNEFLNASVDPYNGGNLDQQAYADLVNRFLSADANRDSYDALAGFYETTGECVQARLCDFWLARATFGNDIVTFYHNMYPVLQSDSQQGRSDAGIVDFVERMRAADRGEIGPGWADRFADWAG